MAVTDSVEEAGTTPTRAAILDGVDDWRAAVRGATALLVELGVAGDDYVQACIDAVEKHGPYIVLTKGVALAHAQMEPGRTRDGLALLRLDTPVEFGHPANDPVDLVFAFSTAGRHLEMIRAFGKALGGPLPGRLRAAGSDEELTELLGQVTADA